MESMKTMDLEKIARWIFIAFVIIAIVMGLVVGYMHYNGDPNYANANAYVTLVLLILGIVVGLVNITAKETTPFLIATIALIVASISNVWGPLATIHELLFDWATAILSYIVAFSAPAAVIIAIKSVFAMQKTK
jgi:hypothetical protein